MTRPVYILGGYQTDFARNWAREGLEIADLFRETLEGGLASAKLDADDIDAAHVGNFTAELFCHQGHLGGFFAASDQRFWGKPASRHEAACASGSMAALSATAEIEAGRYDCVAVLGLEIMRNVPGDEAAHNIGGPAMWSGHEWTDVTYPWPAVFSDLGDVYERRYGLDYRHLAEIARVNYENGRRNPNAHTRKWNFTNASFTDQDDANPVIEGRIRRQDCGQVSDGGAVVFLASEERAAAYGKKRGLALSDLARIDGWGHTTAHIGYQEKLERSEGEQLVFPHVRKAIDAALKRADISSVEQVSGAEIHDCFTTTEYMVIDHLGLTAPGESWKAIEDGRIARGGAFPINPSGGLIGGGHPVGATGVRMMLDCAKQVTDQAGDYQVDGADKFMMLNLGGSATTIATFVVGRGA